MFLHAAENPGQHLYIIKHTLEVLKERFLTAMMPEIPLDAYHMCFPEVKNVSTITQISLAFIFGKHIVTLPNRPSISSN